MTIVGAALVPGMPQLLATEPADSWRSLRTGVEEVARRIDAVDPDVLVIISTQWFTVLGHQFQEDQRLTGSHVDENWYAYDYGRLAYDYRTDVEFVRAWASETEERGMQARLTNYPGFPIDTGTIIANQLLNDGGTARPVAQVSCNLYADETELAQIGEAAAAAASAKGRSAFVLAISGLSSGLLQEWIEPSQDRIGDPEHERWNCRVLDLLTAGEVDQVMALREDYARAAQVDSQFRVLGFLRGAGAIDHPAELLEYGHIWGTGAAVLHWSR